MFEPSAESPVERRGPLRFSLRALLLAILLFGLASGCLSILNSAVRDARRAALAMTAQGSLNQLALALHNYHDVHGCFPPAYLADAQGRPMHSWRILILPFVEQQPLYGEYDFGEPWNGPNNSRLASRIPRVFQTHRRAQPSLDAEVLVVVGPSTAFPGATSTRLEDFRDGAENTLLLVESVGSGIHWMEPRDLDLESVVRHHGRRNGARITGPAWRPPWVVFADSITGYRLDPRLPPQSLRALLTIAGDDPPRRDKVTQAGNVLR